MLAWLVKERQIAPHIPVYGTSKRKDGTFSRADFAFDPERDQFTCPGGKLLKQYRRNFTTPRSGITKCCFAHLKRIPRLSRLRLRGPSGARDEFLLAATAQNLRKLAKLMPKLPPTTQPAQESRSMDRPKPTLRQKDCNTRPRARRPRSASVRSRHPDRCRRRLN